MYLTNSEDIIPIYVKYYNYLIVVDTEFEPKIPPENRWETQGWDWFEYGKWPSNLHFGVKAILNDPESVKKIKSL
jgi:hypothetical protein